MEYRDRVAVITGGASGIGFATARRLAERGMRVVLVDVERAALSRAAEELRPLGHTVATRVCDVSDFDAMQNLAQDVVDELGGVHVVFNNAGVAVSGPISEMRHEDWRWTIDVDLWGPIHGVEAFLPHLLRQGEGGYLLFTASFAGLVPNVGLGPYCVAKYGVVALAEVLHRELRDEDIGVSVLCPMRVATNIGASERNRAAAYGSQIGSPGLPGDADDNPDLAGRVLDVDTVADQVLAAMDQRQLYIHTHEESREFVRRRFQRIDRAYAALEQED